MTASSHYSFAEADSASSASIGLRARFTDSHVLMAGSFVLLMPNVLFALQLRPLAAVIMMAGAIGMIALTLGRRPVAPESLLARKISLPRLGACLVLAFSLLVLGGEAHLMFSNWDWLWRDAVLADLARAPFPPTYQVADQTFILRAPLGMYMLPEMVAKASSLATGHAILLVQNAILLALCLYMLATIAARLAVLVVAIFLSFSGLDALGQVFSWLSRGNSLSTFTMPSHIEQWAGLQYSSVVTQLFWVPNHALPAYWATLLVILGVRREIGLDTVGLGLAASLLWSPFAIMGTSPFIIYLFVRDARTLIASRSFQLAFAASLCFLPVACFLALDAAKVTHEFLLLDPLAALLIVVFLAIEIPHLACVQRIFGELDPWLKPLVIIASAVLLTLPAFKVGKANDLVMRASIPALMILAVAFAQSLAITRGKRPGVFAAGIVILLIGAMTPFQEVRRTLSVPAYAVSDCSLTTVLTHFPGSGLNLDNYLARQSMTPAWLLAPAGGAPIVAAAGTNCWPGIPYDPSISIAPRPADVIRR